ncbi:MAG TPA: histidine kinase N-terminal domain-containing protein [Acidimicrobiales bacterium]|nr:histidine kinase N-terminal domain-containing protein [Acidimicrobiales bacterium]
MIPLAGATPQERARDYAGLTEEEIEHLQRLMAAWGMLSDLCFGDLLLFCPLKGNEELFIVLGQVRPTTNRTLHRSDLVGRVTDAQDRALVVRAWQLGQMVDGEFAVEDGGEPARIQCIPIRFEGRVIGVLSRESPLGVGRKWGELERVYVELFERFARMIFEGSFPFPGDDPYTDYAPRVGDGLLVLDKWGRITYASPNAVNALHRVGIFGNAHGMRIDELLPEAAGILDALIASSPVVEEVEKNPGVTIVIRCIPLVETGTPSGAVVLLRDVSDLRHRDRMLLSKEATIREIHHRVKNNLQTISSLLRLQARRIGAHEGRAALKEAERRIRSIAVVHEILSQEAGEQVPFGDAVSSLINMAREAYTGSGELTIETRGDAGPLSADVATPLALVIAEQLQNAVEHAYVTAEQANVTAEQGNGTAEQGNGTAEQGNGTAEQGNGTAEQANGTAEQGNGTDSEAADQSHPQTAPAQVVLTIESTGDYLNIEVRDNGVGLPPGFSIESTGSLGLFIVRDLVVTQLGGEISMESPVLGEEGGTSVNLTIPVDSHAA